MSNNNFDVKLNDWWNTGGIQIRDFLSDLSGDKSFHEKMHISDKTNVYNYAQSHEVPINDEAKCDLLKEICGELAEKILASKHGVSTNDLFDEDGSFYEKFQDEFNRLYDQIEEQMMHLEEYNKQLKNNPLLKTSTIYTTGAFLFPVKVINDNGNPEWLWAVSQFEDDSYLDGEICDPVESAETIEKLLKTDDDDVLE